MGNDTNRPRERLARKLVMPELVGQSVDNAQIMLRNAGFHAGKVRFVEAYAPENMVVGQAPTRGYLVDRDSPIELRVAKASLLRHMPGIFQLQPEGERHFLRDFLWIFHHALDGIKRRVDDIPRLLRPIETDPEFLPWLASWIALELEQDWPDARKRRWIKRAARLFSIRGTREALGELLEIYLDVRPRIDENKWPYKGFRIGITSTIGVDSVILPPMNLSNCFMVHIPIAYDQVTEEQVVRIHRVIQAEKPAHATYFLTFDTESQDHDMRNFMQIGVSSAIGTDV